MGRISLVELWFKFLVDVAKDEIVVVVVLFEVYVDCLLVDDMYIPLLEW